MEEMEGRERRSDKAKTKVVVVMGATGSGKSRLAIDLATHFPVEVINADAMQVYRGLDVLTNKVPFRDRCGVPHHLLGTADTDVELTARNFRSLAVDAIEDISSRGRLPVVVGGTNYYIQALFSPFLVDDLVEDLGYSCSSEVKNVPHEINSHLHNRDVGSPFDRLKEIDPVAANRVHPNNHRKIHGYLRLYESSGLPPSSLFQGKSLEYPWIGQRWGRPENFRYDCCFLWLDVSLPELDRYVEERVGAMMESGLLEEVFSVYDPSADYTRGLKQAIGVREFENLFKILPSSRYQSSETSLLGFIGDSNDDNLKNMLSEAIEELKMNTQRLVRRQRRRLNRLKADFGWSFCYVDATKAFESRSEESWQRKAVEPCVSLVKDFLNRELENNSPISGGSLASRDLWTRYVCHACGNRVLRGAHEWDQHRKGRAHRKRLYKSRISAAPSGAPLVSAS